jgi:hypothetical protein
MRSKFHHTTTFSLLFLLIVVHVQQTTADDTTTTAPQTSSTTPLATTATSTTTQKPGTSPPNVFATTLESIRKFFFSKCEESLRKGLSVNEWRNVPHEWGQFGVASEVMLVTRAFFELGNFKFLIFSF